MVKVTWLESSADLLREPDPGPTPFLVDRLVVDPSILAIVGPPKVGKTWALLDLAISIATGEPALGHLEVRQGPVILILEESGRAALHRRLSQLCRGRGVSANRLEHLHFAANQRVRLVHDVTSSSLESWPDRIRKAVDSIQPAAVFFDPLARVKGAVDENSQRELAPALDFMRELRDRGQCTVGFVHHAGHTEQGRMRGTSDLEAYWESKVTITRKGAVCSIVADHREAEPSDSISYRLDFDPGTRSLRVEADRQEANQLREAIYSWLAENPGSTFPEIRAGVRKNKLACRSELGALVEARTAVARRSRRPDRNGNEKPVDTYFLASGAGSTEVSAIGTATDLDRSDPTEVQGPPPYRGGTRTAVPLEEVGS